MKTLYLFRHAKSSWKDKDLPDFDRPLKQRGVNAARLMGEYMASHDMKPDLILCSSAARTQETLENLKETLGTTPIIQIEDSLYLAGPNRIVKQLSTVSDDVSSVMILGHNPGLQFLALELTSGNGMDRKLLDKKFPTAALAVLTTASASWSRISPDSFDLKCFQTPKMLQA